MGFQIYQLEKAQAINLLDRVAERMLLVEELGDDDDKDFAREACDIVLALCRNINEQRTQLDAPVDMNLSDLATLVKHYDESGRHNGQSAVDYFARYFSNYNTYPSDFKLAAGEALPKMDELLREVDGEENWLES